MNPRKSYSGYNGDLMRIKLVMGGRLMMYLVAAWDSSHLLTAYELYVAMCRCSLDLRYLEMFGGVKRKLRSTLQLPVLFVCSRCCHCL
jgi:hypothetical protein